MRNLLRATSISASAFAALALASGSAAAADQPIDAFEAAQAAAWNAHDAAGYAAAFDPDVSVIAAQGWHWAGRAELASNLGDGFKLVYARARLRIADLRVRALTPDLALVTLSWSIDGARSITGEPQAGEQRGFQTQLLQRHDEGWVILSQQDTETAAAPTAPSPSQSAAPAPAPPSTFPTTPPPVRRCIVARANGACLIYGKAKPAPTN